MLSEIETAPTDGDGLGLMRADVDTLDVIGGLGNERFEENEPYFRVYPCGVGHAARLLKGMLF